MADEIGDAAVVFGRIDDHMFGIGSEEIPYRARNQVEILVNQRRCRGLVSFLLNSFPELGEKPEISVDFPFALSF